jgi:hypothetical protein
MRPGKDEYGLGSDIDPIDSIEGSGCRTVLRVGFAAAQDDIR